MSAPSPEAHRQAVGAMFGRIAGWYDFLNHFLSMGLDVWWRRVLVRAATRRRPHLVLDLAAGTLDVTLGLLRQDVTCRVAALDIAAPMLAKGRRKLSAQQRQRVVAGVADGRALPLADESVQAVTIAFGIRNILPREAAYAEVLRVLAPGGVFCILEFGSGRKKILRGLYNVYLRQVLPRLGRLISGDAGAYQYLADTIAAFPDAASLGEELRQAGFTDVTWRRMSLGVVYLHTGAKLGSSHPEGTVI